MREEQYLREVEPYLERPGTVRDLLELATWEDYGLFHHVHAFLGRLPEAAADLAVREFAKILGELREARLEYQLGKARGLRKLVLDSASGDD